MDAVERRMLARGAHYTVQKCANRIKGIAATLEQYAMNMQAAPLSKHLRDLQVNIDEMYAAHRVILDEE